MVKHILILGTLSALESSLYEHFNMKIKQSLKRTSQSTQIQMMEMVNVMRRTYKRVQ